MTTACKNCCCLLDAYEELLVLARELATALSGAGACEYDRPPGNKWRRCEAKHACPDDEVLAKARAAGLLS